MVDMSATLIHHGHVRLLKKAAEIGDVVVVLTTDDEIKKKKGYTPELSFEERKEILESIRYVKEVVAGPWLITDEFMDSVNCDLLVHGAVIFPRTEGVSSSTLRERVLDCLIQMNIDSKKGNTGDKVARFMIELIKKEFRLE